MSDIESSVAELVAETVECDVNTLHADTNLREFIVSSVKLLRLVAQLEDRYGVQLNDELVLSVISIADLAEAVEHAQGDTSTAIRLPG